MPVWIFLTRQSDSPDSTKVNSTLKLTRNIFSVDTSANTWTNLKKKMKKLTKKHFSKFIAAGIDSENIEEMYTKCHAAIRADPAPKAKVEKTVDKKRWNRARLSYAQRKNTVAQKKASFLRAQAAEE